MNLKDLKILDKKEIEKIKENFGVLLRQIEYLKNNPDTEKIDLSKIMQTAIEFRQSLSDL